MIILATLALAVLADGYRLYDQPPLRIDNNMLQRTCEQNGVNYTLIEFAGVEFSQCMEVNVQVKDIENEIIEAYEYHTYSALHKVFKKYCPKVPELKACYHKLVTAVGPCLGDDHQDFITHNINLSDRLLDYFCERHGYVITKFIMEGGLECFGDKAYEIMRCAERSKNMLIYTAQNITISEAKNMYDESIKCVLRSVERCPNSTPSKILAEVSEIVRQTTYQGVNESPKNFTEVHNVSNRIDKPTSTNTEEYSRREEIVTNTQTMKTMLHDQSRYWHYTPSITTATERLWTVPASEREWYSPRTTTEQKWYSPTTTTERQWNNPTTTTERPWNYPTTTTERQSNYPTTTTERQWNDPTTTTGRKLYRTTTTTEQQWYNPTTITEKVSNHVNGTWPDKKASGVSAEVHCDNSQGQFGQKEVDNNTNEGTKNIDFRTARKLFKASGSVAVAFNADIFV